MLGRLAEAVDSYDRATALKPDHAQAFSNHGSALQSLGHLEEALRSFDRAIALRPNDSVGYYNRANVLHALGRPDEALSSLDRAVALEPDYAEATGRPWSSVSAPRYMAGAAMSCVADGLVRMGIGLFPSSSQKCELPPPDMPSTCSNEPEPD
jgi:tetratricopeptide (TPR) repeat protein